MDQREYGELIATVKHLSEQVGTLQSSLTAETAKLHGRLDEFMTQAATKAEHNHLAKDVDDLRGEHRKTREKVEHLLSDARGTSVGMHWLRDLIWLVVAIGAAAAGYGTGAI